MNSQPNPDDSPACPACRNTMNLDTSGNHRQFICFVCDRELAEVRWKDSRRWWGKFHLPLIDIVLHPKQAILQLEGHPTWLPVIMLFLITAAVQVHLHPLENLGAVRFDLFLFKGTPLARSLRLLAISLAGISAAAWGLHMMLEKHFRSFLSFWTIAVFLSVIVRWIAWIPTHALFLRMALGLWSLVLWAIAIQTVYDLDVFVAVLLIIVLACLRSVILAELGLAPANILESGPGRFSFSNMRRLRRDAPKGWHLRTLEGKPFEFDLTHGRVVFLHFWSASSADSVAELLDIEKLFDRFKDDADVVFLCATTDPPPELREFLLRHPSELPMYTIPTREVPATLRIVPTPVTYLIDSGGSIVGEHYGYSHWDSRSIIDLINFLAHHRRHLSFP